MMVGVGSRVSCMLPVYNTVMNETFDYHIKRILKGLQDDFDKSRSTAQRIKIAEAMDKLLDTQRGLEYAKEFAKVDRGGRE